VPELKSPGDAPKRKKVEDAAAYPHRAQISKKPAHPENSFRSPKEKKKELFTTVTQGIKWERKKYVQIVLSLSAQPRVSPRQVLEKRGGSLVMDKP